MGSNYVVESFYQPKTVFSNPLSVTAEQCSNSTIIALHTHPYRNCVMSEQDIETYAQYAKRNVLGVVMCDPETFSFYEP